LCRRYGEHYGRPIEVVSRRIAVPGPYGYWFEYPTFDRFVCQRHTVAYHTGECILHEFVHKVAEHPSDGLDHDSYGEVLTQASEFGDYGNPEPINLDLPLPPTGNVTCYGLAYEHQAQLGTLVIMQWASVLDIVHAPAHPFDSATLQELEDSLTHHHGWR
jgi:hypothetical protein